MAVVPLAAAASAAVARVRVVAAKARAAAALVMAVAAASVAEAEATARPLGHLPAQQRPPLRRARRRSLLVTTAAFGGRSDLECLAALAPRARLASRPRRTGRMLLRETDAWIRGVSTYPTEVAIARTRHLREGDRTRQGRSETLSHICSPRVGSLPGLAPRRKHSRVVGQIRPAI